MRPRKRNTKARTTESHCLIDEEKKKEKKIHVAMSFRFFSSY